MPNACARGTKSVGIERRRRNGESATHGPNLPLRARGGSTTRSASASESKSTASETYLHDESSTDDGRRRLGGVDGDRGRLGACKRRGGPSGAESQFPRPGALERGQLDAPIPRPRTKRAANRCHVELVQPDLCEEAELGRSGSSGGSFSHDGRAWERGRTRCR